MKIPNTQVVLPKQKVCNDNQDEIGSDTHIPVVTRPQIDKMAVIVDIPDPALHGMVISGLLDLIAQDPVAFQRQQPSGWYSLALSIVAPDKSGTFLHNAPAVYVQTTSKHSLHPQIRLSFNPYKLFGDGIPLGYDADEIQEYMDFQFQSLWGDGFFALLCHSRVTYLEVWRHIQDRKPEDYLFKIKNAQTSQCIFGSSGNLETLYFGKGSGNQTAIYNKAKQVNKKALHNTTRVEVKLKPQGLLMTELVSLANPLNTVSIHELNCKHPPLGEAHWIAFRDACRFRGIHQAIKMQPNVCHYGLKKAIKGNPVSWWEMDEAAWKTAWSDAMKASRLDQVPVSTAPLSLLKINGGY